MNFIQGTFDLWIKEFAMQLQGDKDAFDGVIVWRRDLESESTQEFGPAKISTLYFHRYRPELANWMEYPKHLVDQHKVIALTQKVILENWPLTHASVGREFDLTDPPVVVRTINTQFAYYFSLHFLGAWNEKFYRKDHFVDVSDTFDVKTFLSAIQSTSANQPNEIGQRFRREHNKLLMAEPEGKLPGSDGTFPLFWCSQLWFALEQWCFAHARLNKNWPKEK